MPEPIPDMAPPDMAPLLMEPLFMEPLFMEPPLIGAPGMFCIPKPSMLPWCMKPGYSGPPPIYEWVGYT